MAIRELNQQELKWVSGGYTPNPDFAPIGKFPLPKWFPIPHPIDPISIREIAINKVIK